MPSLRRNTTKNAKLTSNFLSYPGAVLFSLDGNSIREIAYHKTDHYQVTRDFLNAPEKVLQAPLWYVRR